MKTYLPPIDNIDRKWYLVDAEGKTLGRLASRIAILLRGKHKPIYTPSIDTGDFVVVVNAGKISTTGNKLVDKTYYRHSGYPGGLKATSLGKLLDEKPEEAIKTAVGGMLPKGSLGRKMLKKLRVYAESDHPHKSHNIEPLTQ